MSILIEIQEQPERSRFRAEVEVGGMVARRREVLFPRTDDLRGDIRGMFGQIAAALDEMLPAPVVREPEPPAVEHWAAADEPTEWPAPGDDDKAALVERAKALGIDVDGRWGEARLRQEIAAASHEPAPTGD